MNIADEKLVIALEAIKKSLDPFEKAQIFKDSIREVPISLTSLSRHMKVSPSYISNYIRLLRLPTIVRDGYYGKLMSLSHLFIIARLKNEGDMIKLYERVLQQSLPTSRTEELVRHILHNVTTEGESVNEETKKIIINTLQKIDKKVTAKVIQTRITAKVTLSVKGSLSHTTELLDKIAQILNKGSG